MPVYEYTALDAGGKKTSGMIDADSIPAARQKLRAARTYPVTIQEMAASTERKDGAGHILFRPFVRFRGADLTVTTRQLATLVSAGFPLVSAMDAVIPQIRSAALKRIMARIKDSVVEGSSFAGALSRFPGAFSTVYVNMVHAGESSGTLDIVLARLADTMESRQALGHRIRAAMTYPLLMTVFGALVLFLLLIYIVPTITIIFADMGQVLPWPTRMLIAVSTWLKGWWWAVVLLLGGMGAGLLRFRRSAAGRHVVDRVLLALPVLGVLIRKLAVARFGRTLGSLLQNGVSMMTALEIVKSISGNVLIADAVAEAAKEVGQGQSLGGALHHSALFPALAVQMIRVGEQSGELETMLQKLADIFENEAEMRIMTLTTLMEPLMIMGMGVIVAFIVLSICLPIFEMSRLVM